VLSYADGAARDGREPTAAIASQRPSPRGTAPVRIGLIGPGDFAKAVIVPAFVTAGAKLEAVGGGAGPGAEGAVREFGFERAESETDMLADPAVDAIAVCTRHAGHAGSSAQALRAGKHVFCEKPLALSLAELDDVMDAAHASGGVLAVGFNRRFAPLMAAMREYLGAGGGPVTAIYRVSAGAIPADHWVHDLQQGGGRALGEACHFVDTLSFLGGAPVVDVHAVGHGGPQQPVQAHDNLLITLRLANGSVGSIAYVADGSPRVSKERVEAFSGQRAGVLDNYETLQLFGPDGVDERHDGGRDKGHNEEIRRFVEGIRTGTPPVPLEDVRNVSAATLAIIESLRSGRPVRVDSLVAYDEADDAATKG
jgi:predicted dehydrogenase